MKSKILILTPVYKDWNNLYKLLTKINKIFSDILVKKFDLIVIDDFSNERIDLKKLKFSNIKKIKIIKLSKNVGSQRAIAIGLKFIQNFYQKNYNVITIDSDGQDNPSGIKKLIKKGEKNNFSIVARRGQRKEPLWFKIFYEAYCLIIFLFSLKKIRYGNFSLLRFSDVNKVLKDNNLWNAFPPTLSVNLKNIIFLTIDRQKRFSGKSKMNFFGLLYHALRVFSVLRYRILLLSFLYLLVFYKIFFVVHTFIFFLLFSILLLFNFSNFTLGLSNNKKLLKNFKKIKILHY
jgi:polyisoprenyl-phosphate glycosyltransferase